MGVCASYCTQRLHTDIYDRERITSRDAVVLVAASADQPVLYCRDCVCICETSMPRRGGRLRSRFEITLPRCLGKFALHVDSAVSKETKPKMCWVVAWGRCRRAAQSSNRRALSRPGLRRHTSTTRPPLPRAKNIPKRQCLD